MKYKLTFSIAVGVGAFGFSLLSGCVARESVHTHGTTQVGKGWVESESFQVYKRRDGKRTTAHQVVFEKAKCIGKKGEVLSVGSVDECLKRGGKVMDVIITDEHTCRER